jgi:phospholipid transport system transporter-binding protein
MLLLPATLTADEARSTLRLLSQGLQAEPADEAVIDASGLQEFDSAALAVLLACRRQAQAAGRRLSVQQVPVKLAALAKLYGVHTLLLDGAAAAAAPSTAASASA